MTTTVAIAVWDGITALDVLGPHEVLAHWPDAEVHTVATRPDAVRSNTGLTLTPSRTLDELPEPHVVLVGGGGDGAGDDALVDWLRAADRTSRVTASVCTGAFVLAAAGLLQGRRATTHWAYRDRLAALGVDVRPERVVTDGKYWTAAGISAGIDLGLRLTADEVGPGQAQTALLAMEYAPEPPFPEAGDPATAPAHIVAFLRDMFAEATPDTDHTAHRPPRY